VEEEAHRCLEECKPFDFQYRIVWPDGSVHWVQSKGVFACDGQGQAVQMMGIAQDITERKRTEEALAAASERMSWVARFPEENPNPVMRAAADGTILYCNPAAKKIAGWGYEEGQLLADPLLKAVTMAMASGAEAEEDLDLGDRAYTVFVVPVLREGYANIYGWDITRRKQAEERIFEANQRMDALLKALPVGVSFSDDPECKRVTGNLALLSQFEISTQDNLSASTPDLQAAGRKVRYFRGGREMADFELPLQRAVAENREISPMEIEVRLASGRRWITEASAAPFFDQAGNILGGVCVTLDITERKRFEKELQESKQHLETLLENLPIGVWFTDETGKILYGNAAGREIWRGVRHVGPEEYHEFKAWWADTGIPLGPDDWAVTRAVRKGEISLNETLKIECFDGSQKIIRNSAVPLRANGDRLFGVVVLNEDIMERVRMEEEIRRSEALFKLLSKTAGRLLQTENPQAAVEELCREVMAHLDCQVFFNFLASEGTGRLHLNAYAGIPEEEARKIEWLDYGVAVCGCVARDGLPILADDIFNIPDPRTDLVKSYGVQAYACHPLKIGDRLIGTISFGTKARTRFSAEDVALMRTVTDQVSAAMEKIRLVQELQKSRDELEKRVQERTEELTQSQKRLQQLASQLLRAQEGERKRVAVELHDGLLSELAATKFLLEGKVMLLERGLPVDPGDLRRVADILGGAMKEARRLMNNLHPSILDELGLIATIGWLCGEYQKAYPHIAVRKEIAVSERDIAAEVRVVVYRVLQEALNNFARHGKGDRIEISLAKSEGGFCFEIRDNGQGFDVDTAQRGLGLESMRERVEVSGGEFRIKSAIGQGTSIRAIWTCL
jgi:signal transduction histidine kinase/PAS domain-containing protein